MITNETRITQLPDDLQELISQHLHQSQMKDIVAQLKKISEAELSYVKYIHLMQSSLSLLTQQKVNNNTELISIRRWLTHDKSPKWYPYYGFNNT